MNSPKNNLRLRLEIKEEVMSKIDIDKLSVIDIFLLHELDYLSVLQILSTAQYLQLCRDSINLISKPEHSAFINYSILSLSLEAPVTFQEYKNAVFALTNLDKSKIPNFLRQEIDEFFELINNQENNEQPDFIPHQEEEINRIDVQNLSSVNMTSLFNKEPRDNLLYNKSKLFSQSLHNQTDFNILIPLFLEATNNLTDLTTIFNFFSYQTYNYSKFTNFVLTIVYKSYSANSQTTENISMFKKKFTIKKVSAYFLDICNIVTRDYIITAIPAKEFPPNFDKFLSMVLNTCSEYTNDINYHILAAIQLSLTDINQAIAHFVLAVTYNYSRTKEISDRMAACGIELLIQNPSFKKNGFADALYQFTCDEDILSILTNNTMKFNLDDLIDAVPFFFNFEILRLVMPEEKEKREFILALNTRNIEEVDTIITFRDLCIMRLLNALNKEFSISNSNVFVVTKAETHE